MEESILLSSDSGSRSPSVPPEFEDDLDLPKTKLSDICGKDPLGKSSTKVFSAEPIASTSKCIPVSGDLPRDSYTDVRYGFRPSSSGITKNGAVSQSYVHEITDSDTSLTDFLSDSDNEPIARDAKANIGLVNDAGKMNDTAGHRELISLFDEDTRSRSSSTLPPDQFPDDLPGSQISFLGSLQASFSAATLPPVDSSCFRSKFEKKPSFHDISDSDGSSDTVEANPTTASNDCLLKDTWPLENEILSNAQPELLSSSFDRSEELLSMQSEPILSNSFSVSEFISQVGTNSQPVSAVSQPLASQKRSRPNIIDVFERKRLKELKMKEKSERAAAAEKMRRMKPGECLKYVTVVLDSNIVSEYSWAPDVIEILRVAGVKHCVEAARDPCTVTWTREQADALVCQQEKHVLFLWSTEKLLTSVQFGTLSDTFADFKRKYEHFKLYLCVYGLQNYYRKYHNAMKQQKRIDPPQRKRKSNFDITPDQLEMEFIALQVRFGISRKILNSPQDAAFFLQVITKSVAEMPFKLEKEKIEMERNWYAKGDSKKCVRIDKDFNGLRQLWIQQLSQFNLSSLDIAKSIAELYPTPLSLYEAYRQCLGLKEKENMLQDILVKRGPGGGGRRIGPQLSRKISLMFCQNDDLPLG